MEKKKKRFKMPSAYTTLFIIIMIMAVLTWFIPSGQYQLTKSGSIIPNTYKQIASHPQGLWDVFMAPIIGMIGDDKTSGAISISLFILVIGGFLGVVNKTGALNAGISSIVKNSKGQEMKVIAILTTLFALGGTTFGMGEETIAFYPILFPMMVMGGFDTVVAVAITQIGTTIGSMASTTNPFATGVASQALGISMGDGIIPRLILFIILLAISIWYILHYATKIKKTPSKSLVYDQHEEDLKRFQIAKDDNDVINHKQKIVNGLFIATFGIMILGLVPWSTLNTNWTFFESAVNWLENLPIIGMILGKDMVPFGSWYFSEITMLLIFMSIIVAFVYKLSEEDFISSFMAGTADFVSVALVTAVAKGIQVVMDAGAITDTVLHWGEIVLGNVPSALFVVMAFIFYIPMAFLIPSSSGLAAATMGIMGPMGEFAGVSKELVVTIYQAASGWVGLITPTSAIIMASVQMAHFNYGVWVKFLLKFMGITFVVVNVYLIILSYIS